MDFLLLLLYCCLSQTVPDFPIDRPDVPPVTTTRTIDLDQAREHPENLTTDAIARSFEYVALETTDDCLVSGWAAPYVFAKHIVMESPLDAPMLFDRQGKFLTRIGHRGHGPGEFTEPIHSVFVDAEADRITLFFMRKAMHFDLRGKFIQEEKLWLNPLLNAAGLTQENRQTDDMYITWGGNNRQVAVLLGFPDSCLILTASAANRPFTKVKGEYKMRRFYHRFSDRGYGILYFFKTNFSHPDYFEYYDGTADFYRIYYNGTVEHPFHIRNSAVSQLGEPVTIEFFIEANDYLFLGTSLARSSALSKPEIPYMFICRYKTGQSIFPRKN